MALDSDGYLQWLRSTDLEAASHSDLLQAVEAVLEALQAEPSDVVDDAEAIFESLCRIQNGLRAGDRPLVELKQFRDFFHAGLVLDKPAVAVLEQELREIADGIEKERWTSETYQRFEVAIESYLDGGDEDRFWDVMDDIENLLEKVHESYQTTDIMAREVTAESLVVHQLLLEAMGSWKEAFLLLREESPNEEEPDWSAILARAEMGNRLMVAVQIFNGRLQNMLAR